MKKDFTKYLLSVYVLLTGLFGFSADLNSEKQIELHLNTDIHSLTPLVFESNTGENQELPVEVLIEDKVDEDESETDDHKCCKNIPSFGSLFIIADSCHNDSRDKHSLLYTTLEVLSEHRYILYRVFRL